MKKEIVTILLMLGGSASAQDLKFPPRCNERLLTPTNQALCTDLYETASSAEKNYTAALSKVDSLKRWHEVQGVKSGFLAKFYRCAIEGNSQAISQCLRPALQEVVESLPMTDGDEYSPATAKAKARQANAFIEASVHNQFKECVNNRVAAIDDGISTAHDIASGIGERCRPEATRLADERFSTLTTSLITSPPSYKEIRDIADDMLRPSSLIEVVLDHRARLRAKPQPTKKGAAPRT